MIDTFVYELKLCEITYVSALPVHTLKHTQVYIYMLVHKPMPCKLTYVCAPCECSHLEPLCIHTYIHRCTYFILQKLLYMTPCCANSHMSVPLRVLTLRTSLYTRIYSQAYIDHITDTFVYEPMLCELTYASSLASAHTLKPCFYTYIHWQENTYHVIDAFVYEPMFCELTYVCALASAHT